MGCEQSKPQQRHDDETAGVAAQPSSAAAAAAATGSKPPGQQTGYVVRHLARVPPSSYGLVVGRGGGTVAEIEAFSGAHVTVPPKRAPGQAAAEADGAAAAASASSAGERGRDAHIRISGDAEAVRRAEHRILSLVASGSESEAAAAAAGASDEPQVVDAIRAQAERVRAERAALLERASAAYREGDGAEAKRLAEAAHRLDAAVEEARARAAQQILALMNRERPRHEIDLHGQHVEDALRFVAARLGAHFYSHADVGDGEQGASSASAQRKPLRIVVGAGHHSDGGVARIRPAVAQLLREHGYRFRDDGPGAFLVFDAPAARGARETTQGANGAEAEESKAESGRETARRWACGVFANRSVRRFVRYRLRRMFRRL